MKERLPFACTVKQVLTIITLISLVLLASCVAPHSQQRADHGHLIHDVPFFPQEEFQCGPAALASVLNYWNADVSPDDVAAEIFSKSARGTLTIDMILHAQKNGFYAEQFRGSLEKVREYVDAGYPLVVLVDYGFWLIQANHFMVVIGYGGDHVIVHSGKTANKFLQVNKFLTSWEKTGYWTLLIRRP
jgi:ABC-type bacteriocin/lantibiotic exporter with double-glycine peptidase domain